MLSFWNQCLQINNSLSLFFFLLSKCNWSPTWDLCPSCIPSRPKAPEIPPRAELPSRPEFSPDLDCALNVHSLHSYRTRLLPELNFGLLIFFPAWASKLKRLQEFPALGFLLELEAVLKLYSFARCTCSPSWSVFQFEFRFQLRLFYISTLFKFADRAWPILLVVWNHSSNMFTFSTKKNTKGSMPILSPNISFEKDAVQIIAIKRHNTSFRNQTACLFDAIHANSHFHAKLILTHLNTEVKQEHLRASKRTPNEIQDNFH